MPPSRVRPIARLLVLGVVVTMLLTATPSGAVGLDAHHGTDGVDDGTDASDRGASLALSDDASGPLVGQFDQEDDGDDDDGDEEGEDDEGEEEDEDEGEEDDDDDDDEDGEEDDEDDDADEDDEDEEAEAGDDDDDDDERDDDGEDEDEDDGGDGNPLATLVSELAGDSDDESDGDDASPGENSGDDSGAPSSDGDGSGEAGSGGGNDEDARGDGERPPENVGDVGEGSVDAAQAETPTSTPAPNATDGTPTPEGFRVESVSVNRSTVPSGEPVRITATVVNGWGSTETRRVHLRLFDEVVAARNVTVPGESTEEVSFVRRISAPGTYEASVREAGTSFTVVAEETASPAGGTGLPEVTGVQTPGFTALAAVFGVLGALLLARSRRG